jgi:hypothetical protein
MGQRVEVTSLVSHYSQAGKGTYWAKCMEGGWGGEGGGVVE